LSGAKHRNTEAKVLRRREADLDAGAQHVIDLLSAEACIAPGFQQTPGKVLGQTHPCGESPAEQAAALNKLGKRVGELQQQVEDFSLLLMSPNVPLGT
jgi:hypothetical protein